MTDKELLELAAKAAGLTDCIPYQERWLSDDEAWNPLTDKSDLYYLAKKLHILIEFKHQYAAYDNPNNPIVHLPHEIIVRWPIDAKDDAYAIVMVAAEIGRTK